MAVVAGLALSANACVPAPPAPGPPAPVHDADPTQACLAAYPAVYRGPPDAGARVSPIPYDDGGVIGQVQVIVVLWEGALGKVSAEIRSRIQGFFDQVASGPFVASLSAYDTPRQRILPADAGTPMLAIAPRNTSHLLATADVGRELAAQIADGSLPAPSASSLYMVYLPAGVTVAAWTADGLPCSSTTCQVPIACGGDKWCSFHRTFTTAEGQVVPYGLVPDYYAPDSGCAIGCGASAQTFENVTSYSSHELAESITDPMFDCDGGVPGWYDPQTGDEVADRCEDDGEYRLGDYVVQKVWSNKAGRCVEASAPPVDAGGTSSHGNRPGPPSPKPRPKPGAIRASR